MDLNSGIRLGRHEVRDRFGKGGVGEVYRARDTKLNRDVALKVLPADLAGDADMPVPIVERARKELIVLEET